MNLPPNDTVEPSGSQSDLPPRAISGSALARVDVWGQSHQGIVRDRNEDHFIVLRFGRFLDALISNLPAADFQDRWSEVGYGMAVADGLGGHAAGDTASRMAINILIDLVLRTSDWVLRFDTERDVERVIERTRERFLETSRAMAAEAHANPELEGFGTTMTLAASVGTDLFLAHIGDSRAYLMRDGELRQLTTDHTHARELVERGIIADESEVIGSLRHCLTRLLGDHAENCQPMVQKLNLASGDTLLLCSDGLTNMVDDREIAAVIGASSSSQTAAQRLVELALDGGGRDNITVIVARYEFPGRARNEPRSERHHARR